MGEHDLEFHPSGQVKAARLRSAGRQVRVIPRPGPQRRGEGSRVSRGTLRTLGCPQFSGLETPAKTSNVGVRRATLTYCRLHRLHRLQRAASAQCRALGQAKNTIHRGTLIAWLADCGLHAEGGEGSSLSSSFRVTQSKLLCSCLLLVLLHRILSRTLCSHNSSMVRPI